jgi:hypothetical protein
MRDQDPLSPAADLTEFERDLLEAAMRDRMPAEVKQRMAQALRASLSAGGAPTSAPPGASAGTAGTWLFSKATTIGLASALAVGGAVGWQITRDAHRPDVSEVTPQPVAPLQPTAAKLDPSTRPPNLPALASHVKPEPPARASGTDRGAALGPKATVDVQLREEIALLDATRRALKQATPRVALDLLARHASRFPQATLAPEADALRIEALEQAGDSGQARTLARRFLTLYPDSPLAARVQRMTAAQTR